LSGINFIRILLTDGERHVSVDFRICNATKDGLIKNDHFRSMLQAARQRAILA
jgi:hypothetical protein